jgi:GNAT superfamily N-acetyltransferase
MARCYTWCPLTPDRWDDLVSLFGPNGASGGCWCMSFRLANRAQFRAQCADAGAGNSAALRALTDTGEAPGILAYDGDIPVGWCAVGPREAFPRLDRSPLSRRLDDTPVWSIVCFYTGRAHRRRGVLAFLVGAAVEYVRERGGRIVEAYPRREAGDHPMGTSWSGLLPVFEAAGFEEIARPSSVRAVVRYTVRPEADDV